MKLFLASDVRKIYKEFQKWLGDIKGSKVAWIQNGCDVYDDPYWIAETKSFFIDAGAELIEVDLRTSHGEVLGQMLETVDGIYVTGGNIFYLLDIVRRSGLDGVLEDLKNKDIWYAGSSAGAALLGKSIAHCNILDDETKGPDLASKEALGWLEYCFLPHRGKEKYRQYFEKIFELKNLPAPLLVMEDHHYITIER